MPQAWAPASTLAWGLTWNDATANRGWVWAQARMVKTRKEQDNNQKMVWRGEGGRGRKKTSSPSESAGLLLFSEVNYMPTAGEPGALSKSYISRYSSIASNHWHSLLAGSLR